MDPHSFIARAEAQRWLQIAEKLLMSHDLVGSKSFAIRARESDPRLEAADQILAIADTLLAAEKRVVGNNGAHQPDFYAILQLVRFVQDTEHISSQYRRLAVMLNPHHNRFPYSDQAFQLVNDAWSVLSNPTRKSMYDAELDFPPPQQMNTIGFNLEQHHHHQQHQQEQHDFFSIDHMESDHEHEFPEPQQTFQTRAQPSHQQQQLQHHNFLSHNSVRSAPFREEEQLFQHHEQEQLFQPEVQPFVVSSAPHQQTQPPQPPMQPPTPPPAAAPPQPPLSWPQAPSQPPQHKHQQQPQLQQQRQQIQQEQQQQESLEQNATPIQHPIQINSDNGVKEEETEAESETEEATDIVDESPTFWTTCPFCFYMYEFPKVYADCTLRCDNCKRAFQAVKISSPPSIVEGQETYISCWGYFPIGVSISHLPKSNGAGTNSKWTPFSPLYVASSNVQDHFNGSTAPKKNPNRSSGPRVYIDDVTDDIFTGISEPSDDSDVEWNITKEKR